MVKPDPKHNYYADLSLPTTCSIDEVRKQYRRLALLYHPDRNAGKEEEVVPKFQAIQTAHEVLSDATLKAKYDGDRRKAGLYPLNRPAAGGGGGGAAGYSAGGAASAYPPPPRRTQPGVWSRPPGAGTAGTAGGMPTGADRFTNFTRPPAPTARKDATTDRKNNFNAWQNLNTAQERQQQQQQSQRFASGTAPPPPPSPVNSSNRPRPPPPPRADTKLPSEDEIRSGFNYHKPAASSGGFNDPGLDPRQTAWAAHHHQKNGANSPSAGVGRSNTTRTPRKPTGFDPNAPGSDERPAPAEQSGYSHSHSQRHRSEDFGQMPRGTGFMPPPPPPPPSMGGAGVHSPTSPSSAQSRPFGDPLRPSKSRGGEAEQVPYAECTRTRTPYTNFSGEKTPFTRTESGDGLRRTASTRDTTKLNGNAGRAGRARSTSPLAKKKPFVEYSDSDVTDNGRSSEESEEGAGGTESQSRPGTASASQQQAEGRFSEGVYSNRRMKVPTPPSRMNGSRPGSKGGDGSSEVRPGMAGEGMGMKGSSKNMYVGSDFFDSSTSTTQHQHYPYNNSDTTRDGAFDTFGAFAGFGGSGGFEGGGDAFESAEQHDAFQRARQRDVFEGQRWRERMFGSLDAMYDKIVGGGKKGGVSVPLWAFPSSVAPFATTRGGKASRGGLRGGLSRGGSSKGDPNDPHDTSTRPIPIPPRKDSATTALHCDRKPMTDHEAAFAFVHQELEKQMGDGEATKGLDVHIFSLLASTTSRGEMSGNGVLDEIMLRALHLFPGAAPLHFASDCCGAGMNEGDYFANTSDDRSFNFPFSQDMFNNTANPPHATSKTRSEEKINTTFTPEGWEGRFTASGDYFAPPTGTGKGERSGGVGGRKGSGSPGKRMRSERGLRSTNSSLHVPSTTPMGMPPPLSHSPSAASAAGESDGGVKFPKEHWEKTFKDASWSWPPPPPPGLPASLAGRGAPRVPGRKGSKRSEKGQQAEQFGEERVEQEESPVGGGVGAGDEDAMDIDSTPPAAKHQTQQESEKVGEGTPTMQNGNGNGKEARMYAVPPSAWRQSQTNGHAASNRGSGGGANGNLKTNLDDLAHVEPLARTTNSAGLGSLSDVHDTLPFTSEASTTIPTQDDGEPMPATPMPAIPKAPEPPTKLTKQSWHAFAANFGAYLQAFHAFNTSMIHHFAAREQSAQDLLGVGNLKWLESAGDTVGGGSAGFGTYLQGVKEDERVRELWGLGCERHADAIRGFGAVRERVRKLGAGGGLSEH
ncbi:hypothetical protein LTR10_012318 [Elasticomyces elasticus]|nr:hypothetical protein LTR10_012318 [Elasticomyces elasticus]KAK4965793.1 hypothetical protein LTR42_011807 [Elasticomyces elasticus]